MSKVTLQDITSGYNSTTKINANNTTIEDAFDNTLSRDGSSPNTMNATLDMNSKRILNLGSPAASSDAARWADVTSALAISTALPSQTGNADKAVFTDGSTLSFRKTPYTARTTAEVTASVTPTNYEYAPGNVLRYGTNTTPGTTDMTAAINNAIACAQAGHGFVYLPSGNYKVISQLTAIAGQVYMYGDGKFTSYITFAPSANGACIKLSNGASQVTHCVLRDFGVYSTDSTYTKVALDLYDISMCTVENIYIRGNGGAGPGAGAMWSGASSIGVRTNGRDQCSFNGMTIFADRPYLVAANPNTTANDCEELDHFNFHDQYLVANGNPVFEVTAGYGVQDLTFTGYQAWVGGAGGFKMNDTRAAPTVPSHGIRFANTRTEQQTDASKYAFDVLSTFPIQQLSFDNVFLGTGTHGFKVNGADHLRFSNCTTALAAGKDAVNLTAINSRATLVIEGCYWGTQTTNFTLSNFSATVISGEKSGAPDYSGPSNAVYVAVGGRPGTTVNVATVVGGYSTITYSASMTPNAALGNTHTITATNGTAFTINAPTNGVTGQRILIKIKNTSGGALGVATWNANYKMSAWTSPATGFSRSIEFEFDGASTWTQINQTGVDVPN